MHKANLLTSDIAMQVKAGNSYHSCCVVVKNMQRCLYAIPNGSIFHTEEMIKLEKEAEESRISPSEFRKKLQVYSNIDISSSSSYLLCFILCLMLMLSLFFFCRM